MNYIQNGLSMEQRHQNYIDAKNDLIKAMNSVSKLDLAQRNQLASEIISAEAAFSVYSMLRQFFG